MCERRDFLEDFLTETWTVYVSGVRWMTITQGKWASLELMVEEAQTKVNELLADADLQVTTYYLNTDKNELRFYTGTKREEWWTL